MRLGNIVIKLYLMYKHNTSNCQTDAIKLNQNTWYADFAQ